MQARFRQLFSELRRRGVFKAGGIYLAAGWVLIQVVDVALRPIGFPEWLLGLVVWLVMLGFPLTLAFSWRYDISLQGITRTPPDETFRKRDLIIRRIDLVTLAAVALFIGLLTFYLADILREQQAEISQATAGRVAVADNSIAVLPFKNLSGVEQEAYLGQGLAEDILHRLASIRGIQVASRTASFELDTGNMDMATIGQRLAVQKILEGSVRRDGDRVRIVAQLIDSDSGYHLWSGRYDRRIEDLFRIYDEISTAVVSELQLTLAPEADLVKPPPTDNMEAYDYFLQARSILQRVSQAQNAADAQRFFANAVERDPMFAGAWAGQCRAYLEWHHFEPSTEKVAAAEQSCSKALELSPGLTEGHVALGDLYRNTGAFERAMLAYNEALKADPYLAIAWRGLGQTYDELGSEAEAENALSKAVEFDPDDLVSLYALGDYYFSRGRYADAEAVYKRMVQHPGAGRSALNSLGAARFQMGDFEGAAAAFRQVIAQEPTAVVYSNVGIIYYLMGRFEDAAVMHREAVSLAPSDPFNWGNLGDSLLETEEGTADARQAYQRAVDLSEELRMVNLRDIELLTNLAHYYARLGDDESAMRYLDQVLSSAPNDTYAYYYASLVHLEAGRTEQALTAITRSVELNYPIAQLRSDPQFTELRSNKQFLGLLDQPNQSKGSN